MDEIVSIILRYYLDKEKRCEGEYKLICEISINKDLSKYQKLMNEKKICLKTKLRENKLTGIFVLLFDILEYEESNNKLKNYEKTKCQMILKNKSFKNEEEYILDIIENIEMQPTKIYYVYGKKISKFNKKIYTIEDLIKIVEENEHKNKI